MAARLESKPEHLTNHMASPVPDQSLFNLPHTPAFAPKSALASPKSRLSRLNSSFGPQTPPHCWQTGCQVGRRFHPFSRPNHRPSTHHSRPGKHPHKRSPALSLPIVSTPLDKPRPDNSMSGPPCQPQSLGPDGSLCTGRLVHALLDHRSQLHRGRTRRLGHLAPESARSPHGRHVE